MAIMRTTYSNKNADTLSSSIFGEYALNWEKNFETRKNYGSLMQSYASQGQDCTLHQHSLRSNGEIGIVRYLI